MSGPDLRRFEEEDPAVNQQQDHRQAPGPDLRQAGGRQDANRKDGQTRQGGQRIGPDDISRCSKQQQGCQGDAKRIAGQLTAAHLAVLGAQRSCALLEAQPGRTQQQQHSRQSRQQGVSPDHAERLGMGKTVAVALPARLQEAHHMLAEHEIADETRRLHFGRPIPGHSHSQANQPDPEVAQQRHHDRPMVTPTRMQQDRQQRQHGGCRPLGQQRQPHAEGQPAGKSPAFGICRVQDSPPSGLHQHHAGDQGCVSHHRASTDEKQRTQGQD